MEEMEKHLSEIYGRAQKEIEKKTADFWKDFDRKDAAQKKLLDAGKITDDQYKSWRQGQMMTGKHWEEMTKTVSAEMLNADKTAAAYVNGKLPEIYALNYNQLKDATSGIKGYSFEMVDAATVRNLATSDKTLLPYKKVNDQKVERWNTQKVNAEVMQGIIQGESIPNIAKRLGNVTEMEKNSAIRNARTTTTSAENKGRMDSYHEAQKQGLILKKRWIATHDLRTRYEHLDLDGVTIDVDEPFVNDFGEIMYPADPDALPANVYNCRCTLVTIVEGFEKPETNDEAIEETVEVEENITEKLPDNYNDKKVTSQIEDTEPLNSYDYWSEEEDRKRFASIKEQTGFDDAKAEDVLKAFSGDRRDYKPDYDRDPEGWFMHADTRIRNMDGEEWAKAAKDIDDYIIAAPKYEGEIFRGLSLDAETIANVQVGGIFEEQGVLSSWTSAVDVADMFAQGRTEELGLNPVIIKTANHPYSSPVAHLSIYGTEEKEVIVSNMHGTKYVIESKREENGITIIELIIGG